MATHLLKQAFERASELPEDEQNFIAQSLIRAIESDSQLWDAAFASSVEKLDELAEQALAEYRAGRTEPLDPDKL